VDSTRELAILSVPCPLYMLPEHVTWWSVVGQTRALMCFYSKLSIQELYKCLWLLQGIRRASASSPTIIGLLIDYNCNVLFSLSSFINTDLGSAIEINCDSGASLVK
jgi:hypothetical protein